MAEQEHPVRRRVALKVIKVGMDTRSVIARFEVERQALAMMDHPNIAKVFDAGQTSDGRPYFVMELVKGVPVTDYCDTAKLGICARLELFAQICHAVQHAHQKGLIHRDIKPSNILVSTQDERPLAKVIDFGIAKATQARLTEKTLFTEFRQLIGTPEYMSPEQAEGGLDIDTRTDVYSLGVLMYELVTGTTPFDGRELRSKAYGEMQRLIREVDPPKPSTRIAHMRGTIASVAAHRGVEPRRLNTIVRGELDWIVMRAMEKDRARRYETANGLAADVLRYLADEPVSAGPPSQLYRMRKFVRRHKGPMIASAVVLAVLIAGVVGTTIGLIGQARQRAIAERERGIAQDQAAQAKRNAAMAEAVSEFQADMLRSADPGRMMGDKVTVLQAVTAAVRELDNGKLKDQPVVESSVRGTIGQTLRGLGRYDDAERELRKALALRRAAVPPGDVRLVDSLSCLASALGDQGRHDEAEGLMREALAICRAALPPGDPITVDTLNNVGHLRQAQGRFAEAEAMFREALDVARRATPRDDFDVATAMNNLGHVYQMQGRFAEAEPLYGEALHLLRTVLPPGHPIIGTSVNNVALLLLARGRFDEAEPLLREALDIRRKVLPAAHPEVAAGLNNLGGCLKNLGRLDEAERLYREALDVNRAALPAGHPHTAATVNNLARLLQVAGKLDGAETLMRESLAMRRAALPAGHPDIAQSLGNLAELLAERKHFDEAEPLLRESLDSYLAKFGNGHAQVGMARLRLGRVRTKLKRFAEAEAELVEARRVLATPPASDRAARSLAELYTAWDRAEPGKGYDDKARAAAAAEAVVAAATTQSKP
jgi:tetratricopeptide (TPR) repeat protein